MKTAGTLLELLSNLLQWTWLFLSSSIANEFHSQWNTAFANAPTAISTDSPPAAINDIPQALPNSATNQYSIQYGLSSNVPSISSTQSVSQPPFNGQQQLLMIARDWQHKVASVYDPHGLKRRWDYSVDVETADLSKHQRWKNVYAIYLPLLGLAFRKENGYNNLESSTTE